jgi:protein-disulfide isomerase
MFKNKSSLYAPILVVLLVAAAFYIGRLSAQLTAQKGGTTTGTENVAGTPTTTESKISIANLKVMAKGLGVDTTKFNKCLDDGTMKAKVDAQSKEGQGLGVTGTPSFLINGLLVVGSLPQADFEKVIDAEIKNGTGATVINTMTGEKVTRQKTTSGTGYIKGSTEAKVKIIEYTDFECPYCNMAFPTIEALLAKYGNQISLEYRSFPLSFHADAQKAAEAALCAGEQGKFWEMHDKMFTVMAEK